MEQKRHYQSPGVLQDVSVLLESRFLGASIVDNTTVTTSGQEVQIHDISDDSFNHQWEDLSE